MVNMNQTSLIFSTSGSFINGSGATLSINNQITGRPGLWRRLLFPAGDRGLPEPARARDSNPSAGTAGCWFYFDTRTYSDATVQVTINLDHSNSAAAHRADYSYVGLGPTGTFPADLSSAGLLSSAAAPGALPLGVSGPGLGGKTWNLLFESLYKNEPELFEETTTVVNYLVEVFLTR